MGLMMLIAMPYFGGFKSEQLRSVARTMAGRATYLYDEASAQKRVIRMVFALDHQSYRVMVLDPYAGQPVFTPDPAPGNTPVVLPSNVAIRDVTVAPGQSFLVRATLYLILSVRFIRRTMAAWG